MLHLKNFSLLHDSAIGPMLSPAYDLLSTALVNPADDEDFALTLNGKKKRIKRRDFEEAFTNLKLDRKQQAYLFSKMIKVRKKWHEFIEISFLSPEFRSRYNQIIAERFERIAE